MKPYIGGIQQIGIGVEDVHEAYAHYSNLFGADVPIFEEAATAKLMLPYTGGKPQDRHAILALNLRGGGGFEIWQYTSRKPQAPKNKLRIGDLGLYMVKIKTSSIKQAFTHVINNQGKILSEISKSISGKPHFYMEDKYGNLFEIIEVNDWFSSGPGFMGGVYGVVIGVSDMMRSKLFYKTILGYDQEIADKHLSDPDLKTIPGGDESLERLIVTHSAPRQGPFSGLLGSSEIELVKASGEKREKIFADRYWGDLGYIHLCFDIQGMEEMRAISTQYGHPFTVDSANSFDMGEAAGHFSYIEDPDGALIEFVETHKIPIIKKLGWYLNLQKRDPQKRLPRWMLKALRFSRRKVEQQ